MGKCKKCKYYDSRAGCEGYCRRHSPVAKFLLTTNQYQNLPTVWPEVKNTDWCGDFELTEKENA